MRTVKLDGQEYSVRIPSYNSLRLVIDNVPKKIELEDVEMNGTEVVFVITVDGERRRRKAVSIDDKLIVGFSFIRYSVVCLMRLLDFRAAQFPFSA